MEDISIIKTPPELDKLRKKLFEAAFCFFCGKNCTDGDHWEMQIIAVSIDDILRILKEDREEDFSKKS